VSARARIEAAVRRSGLARNLSLLLAALAALLCLALPAVASAAPPAVTIDPAAGITATSAEVSGEVGPEGAATTWTFQYISAEAYDQNLENSAPGFQGAINGPTDTTETAEPVSGELTGLQPGTRYHLRLLAESSEGADEAVAPTFKTPGAAPLVKAWAAGPVASTAADINAQVDPRGSATVYWFEWGSENCETGSCASIPAEHDASAGAGQIYVYVLRHLSGLAPETTYHFRIVAENDSGTTEGPDQTFTTAAPDPACTNQGMPGTDSLPDCRAYEMVSPIEKNGQDVVPNSYKVFAAEEGEGVSYSAIGPFGDAKGTSVDVQYLSRRTAASASNGWATHSINPLGRAPDLIGLVYQSISTYEALTPDLSAGIYKSWGPLTEAPDVAGVINLSRIGELDASQPQVDLLTAAAAPLVHEDPFSGLALQNTFEAGSKDLSHVIFQSPWNLTGDGSFTGFQGGNLYESAEGAGLRRVGRVPAGTATECDDSGAPLCEDAAGAEAGFSASLQYGSSQYSTGMISDDGFRILFRTPQGPNANAIYMREDGERTYQLNASERTTPDTSRPAQIWGMSADGSRVFFTTDEALLDEDEDGTSSDLYMYEVEKPVGQRLTLLSVDETGDPNVSVTTVLGASEDGHYVYFAANGQLVPGETWTVIQGIYLWHDGTISYLGTFDNSNVARLNTPATAWPFATGTKTSRVSPDGRSLLFMSTLDYGFAGRGGYPGADHGTCDYGGTTPCRELYLYSADSGRLTCVSCSPSGDAATGVALTDAFPGASASLINQHLSHALADDGRRVFFSTPEPLVPEDTNGNKFDAYEYDVASGTPHLISSGTSSADSYFMDAGPDGRDVFFATRQQLLGWDNDDNYDLYDARVDGGFPEPAPVPAACEGESCLPGAPDAPGAPPTASQNAGSGNPRAPRCRKGTKAVKRGGKTRCVKKHHKRVKKHHKRANANRRAGR
jgi:hypothetical protein